MAQAGRIGFALGVLAFALAPACFSQAVSGGCVQRPSVAAVSRLAGDWRTSAAVRLDSAHEPVRLDVVDAGPVAATERVDRMILLLEAPGAKQEALDWMLAAQQTPGSCDFHRWMSAGEFGDAYANSAADVREVVDWLEAGGFQVAPLPAGRGWIEFSGTAGQVELAFGASLHRLTGRGGERMAQVGAISVPAALRPLVHGLVSLDGARSDAAITQVQRLDGVAAEAQGGANAAGVTPAVASRALRLSSTPAMGQGESIAIIGRAGVNAADVSAFRAAFGLPAGRVSSAGDVGATGSEADRALATLEAEWAGVAAPGAAIQVHAAANSAATDGVDFALAEAVDAGTAHTLLVGYASCEAGMSETHQAFYRAVYRQAAAEGISVIAATGDSGAAGCHAVGSSDAVTSGYAVSALAATAWNTAVSAAAVNGSGVEGWSGGGYAAGGGTSVVSARPEWQFAVAGATGRQLPDVSIPMEGGSAGSGRLEFCFGGGASCKVMHAGGSGGAAALFGGISAALAQRYGAQGNLAPGIYALSGTAAVEDVRAGDAKLACVAGTAGCGADQTIGFAAGDGYDLATGLGVPNADALLKAWANLQSAGTTATQVTLTVAPPATNDTYNPSAQITFTASVMQSGSGTPTGTVTFKSGNSTLGTATVDGSGNAKLVVASGLATGSNSITATYGGDSFYAASTSQTKVITITPSSTSMTLTASSNTPAAGSTFTVTDVLSIGTPAAGATAPTGKVTLNVDGVANTTATLTTVGSGMGAVFTVTAPAGATSHTLQAFYPGDANYLGNTSTPITITTTKGATVTTLTATPTTLSPTTPETLTATVAPSSATGGTPATISGTVAFYDGTTLLGTAPLASNTATLSNVTLSTATAHQLTAVYSGDTNWATSTSAPLTLAATVLPDTVTLTVNPANAGPGQVVTLTATVTPSTLPGATAAQNPTGNVVFYNGTQIIATAPLVAGPNNTGVATLLNATLPAGNLVITAYYVGDLYYASGTSNAVTLTVQDFTITQSGTNPPTNLDVIKGQAGNASFVVTGLGGFNGTIQVTCAVPTQDFMTCTPNPQQVTPTGTVSFTVQTFLTGGPASGAVREAGRPGWLGAMGGTALAGLFLLIGPMRRRSRWLTESGRRVLGILVLLGAVGFAGLGCTSVSGTAANGNSGTPLGVATLKITGTAYVNNTVVSHSVYLTVNVLPPK